MTRIVHLLSQRGDAHTRSLSGSLLARLGASFEPEQCERKSASGAWLELRRRERRGARIDLLHIWGNELLPVAAIWSGGPIVFTPSAVLRNRDVKWLRAICSLRRLHVACQTATQRRTLVERGVPLERCHLIRPGVDFARVRRRADASLRRQLGLRADDYVILAAGESSREAAHEQAAWAVSILHVVDARYKLLLWGRGAAAPRAEAMGRHMKQPQLCRLAEGRLGRPVPFEALLPAADAVVVSARGPVATYSIAQCMAAGLPIISTVTYSVSELLEDRHNALMAPPGKPRLLAQRILDLRADPKLEWSISDTARTEAYEFFSVSRFAEQHRELYRQLLSGDVVEIHDPPPGAGLRMMGRV